MKLTSNEALKLLDNSRGLAEDDNWITHCICVGNSAGKIAQKLKREIDNLLGCSVYELFDDIEI